MMIEGLGESSGSSNQFADAGTSDGITRLAAGAETDWFEDPAGEYTERSAPVLWFGTVACLVPGHPGVFMQQRRETSSRLRQPNRQTAGPHLEAPR